MFLNEPLEWVGNFLWDTLHEILIVIFDHLLYSIVGFLYKVFVMLGSMDIFGNNDGAMSLYTEFTNRLYGAIGIIMIFILSYQIILFIIDPDKGAKASSQLIKNLVRGIVLVALCPLIFHYAAVFQRHILEDNTIWAFVMGNNSTSSNNAIEAGNSMASMVYMTMFHPAGTEYNDFYNSSGELQPYKEACAGYAAEKGGNLDNTDDDDDGDAISKSSSRVLTWGARTTMIGAVFGVPKLGIVGGLIGGAIDVLEKGWKWLTSTEDPKMTSCQLYWIDLYVASGGAGGPADGEAINKMSAYSLSDTAKDPITGEKIYKPKIGIINAAGLLTVDNTLSNEVKEEGTMEYFHFAPVVGGILVFMLIAYSLDMAYRAFKLAFLEMIAPIPILLGVIPKQEGIFNKWLDLIVKTYIDVFVRTFVMAFTVYMINLLPTFISALFGGNRGLEGGALLKSVVIIFIVIGLLRFAKELPDLIKDIAKSGSGLLKDIDINPKNSFKNAKAGIDNATKPIGAAAGALAGGIAALKSSHDRNQKENSILANVPRGLKGAAALVKGMKTGGKEGWKTGLAKGSMTNAVNRANVEAGRKELQRDAIFGGLAGLGKPGGVQNVLGILSNGRFGEFKNAWKNNLLDDQLLQAGTIYRDMSNGGKQFFKGADSQVDIIKENAKKSLKDIKYRTYPEEIERKRRFDVAINSLEKRIKNGDSSQTSFGVNGKTYEAKTTEELIQNLKNERDSIIESEYFTTYHGKEVTGADYNQLEKSIKTMETQDIREKQIAETAKVIAEEGYGNVQLYAAKSQELDMRNKDILNPTQLKVQGDELEKAFSGAMGDTMQKFLGIDDSQKRDLGAITQALQKIDFKKIEEKHGAKVDGKDISEDDIRKMVGELVVSISEAEGKVASKVRNIQSSIAGTKVDMVGRSMDNLTPGPKGDGKGDKK